MSLKKCSVCKAYLALELFPGKARQSVCKECRKKRSREENTKIRGLVLDSLGGECACCGEQEYVFLDLDHINNDGAKDRGRATWRLALQEPERFQILCRNCNWAKFMGGCPHARRT